MACEKLTQVLTAGVFDQIAAQETLNRVRHFGGKAAIPDGPGDRLMQANRAAQAEVIRIQHAVADFQLLAFDPNVSNPMLATTVGASGNVQFQVLLEAGEPLFQFLDQPSRKALGLCDRELAELGAAAGNGSTPEWRSAHA